MNGEEDNGQSLVFPAGGSGSRIMQNLVAQAAMYALRNGKQGSSGSYLSKARCPKCRRKLLGDERNRCHCNDNVHEIVHEV